MQLLHEQWRVPLQVRRALDLRLSKTRAQIVRGLSDFQVLDALRPSLRFGPQQELWQHADHVGLLQLAQQYRLLVAVAYRSPHE